MQQRMALVAIRANRRHRLVVDVLCFGIDLCVVLPTGDNVTQRDPTPHTSHAIVMVPNDRVFLVAITGDGPLQIFHTVFQYFPTDVAMV